MLGSVFLIFKSLKWAQNDWNDIFLQDLEVRLGQLEKAVNEVQSDQVDLEDLLVPLENLENVDQLDLLDHLDPEVLPDQEDHVEKLEDPVCHWNHFLMSICTFSL